MARSGEKFDIGMDKILIDNGFEYFSDWEYGPIDGWSERCDMVTLKLFKTDVGYWLILRRHAGGENKEFNIGLSNNAQDIINARDILKKVADS